ncbi:MAG: DUF3106 domain-containing protein [Alcanivoracaceae bacterium]|nr:DUF3106 domain-containing protein [Alcanivoracaceae bacterium]
MKTLLSILFILESGYVFAQFEWQDLNQKQQNLLLPFHSQWLTLDQETREKLVTNTNKWLDMTPKNRKESRKKLNRFKQLSPNKQKQLLKTQKRFQQLSPEQKRRMRRKFNQLSPAQKRKKLRQRMWKQQGQKLISEFDIEKRQPLVEMFKNLSDINRFKLRRYLKNLSPKQRHALILDLLEMNDINRVNYIESL